jgi:PPOX class probable F420-dependent enzyme
MALEQRQATLTEEQLLFLAENPFVGVLTTLRPDGSPHSTVVWVDVEEGVVSFNTEEGPAKVQHLDDDPRVSLLVLDPSDPTSGSRSAARRT